MDPTQQQPVPQAPQAAPQQAPQVPQQAAPQQALPQEPVQSQPPAETYSGPTDGDIVGDTRRMVLSAVDPAFEGIIVPYGEAWQGEGGISGTGALAVLLFETVVNERYLSASTAYDVSPLTILAKRLSRSTLLQVDVVDDETK